MEKSITLTSPLDVMVPIIKVVGDWCNLRCKYCFYNNEDQLTPHKMSDESLQRFITQYMNTFSGHLDFIWHGGETTLAGLPFFQKAVELQVQLKKPDQIIQNYIQTNATLIDHEWAEFFSVHQFRVGISLDGDQVSHDLFRQNHSGKGSFEAALRGFKLLQAHGIKPGIIQTLTKSVASRTLENFEFFTDILGTKTWAMNTFLARGYTNPDVQDESLSNTDFIRALRTCTDLWLRRDDEHLSIREIENLSCGAIDKTRLSCSYSGSCSGYFCLDYNGDIYPCDRASHNPDMCFGNLYRSSLPEILNSRARLEYAQAANFLPPDCLKCEWQFACHNGCPFQRYSPEGHPALYGKYHYCQARRELFPHLREILSRSTGEIQGDDTQFPPKGN